MDLTIIAIAAIVLLLVVVLVVLRVSNKGIKEQAELMNRRFRAGMEAATSSPFSSDRGNKVAVSALRPGDVLAQDIQYDEDKILLEEGTELTRSKIEKLKNWHIESVFIR